MKPKNRVPIQWALTGLLLLAWAGAPTLTTLAAHPFETAAGCTAGPHSGEISADQTWCAADNPHLVNDEVTVAPGVTLTIEAGATIRAADAAGITVLGDLEAPGTQDQPILFTSQTDTGWEQWRGLAFSGSAAKGTLRYSTVRYGGVYHSLSGSGSFAEVYAYQVGAGKLTLEHSTIGSAAGSSSGHTYGIQVTDSQFSMTSSTISGLGNASDDSAMRVSGANTLATISNNTFAGNPGTTLIVESGPSVTVSHNDFHGNWLAINVASDAVVVDQNQIYNNGATADPKGGILVGNGSPTISRNVLKNNTSNQNGAIQISRGSPLIVNNAILDNITTGGRCSAINSGLYASPVFKHNTISNNTGGDGSAICAAAAEFYNTIIAGETIGVSTLSQDYTVSMSHTLWDNVATKATGDGTLNEVNSITGAAALDTDGYHLTTASNALTLGIDVGVTTDIDGDSRPQPAGSAPDIGADEYASAPATSFTFEFQAGAPKLEAIAGSGSGSPQAISPNGSNETLRMAQDFYIFWHYGSGQSGDPQPFPVQVTNSMSTEQSFDAQETTGSGDMTFQQIGQSLYWSTPSGISPNRAGYLHYKIHYSWAVQSGSTVTNTIYITAGVQHFAQTIDSVMPYFAPKIIWPIDGEMCADQFMNVSGYALPGSVIKLYEDDGYVATGTANLEDGLFMIQYSSNIAGVNNDVALTATSCNPSNPSNCSPPSHPVHLIKQTSFWCPKTSYWDGSFETVHGGTQSHSLRFGFRDSSGKLVTENWNFFAGTGLTSSNLSLHLCQCPDGIHYPLNVNVNIGDAIYFPDGSLSTEHIPVFKIPFASGQVTFKGECGTTWYESHGEILVDPDGYIFDVTQGFDAAQPELHVLPGTTVKLMVDEPELGGWVPWPAHLYSGMFGAQVNPQVTGSDGYYAFYTPPGSYYLQVSGKPGFQAWRSPVITVTDQLVHVNVPLTPVSDQNQHTIHLTTAGPDQATLHIQPGETVEWIAEMDPELAPDTRILHIQDPVIRLLSGLNPLFNVRGWDGGMLTPGSVFRRVFDQPGRYTYSDGLGHTGMVVVGNPGIYLPMVRR
jgi:hypothetical protein